MAKRKPKKPTKKNTKVEKVRAAALALMAQMSRKQAEQAQRIAFLEKQVERARAAHRHELFRMRLALSHIHTICKNENVPPTNGTWECCKEVMTEATAVHVGGSPE